MAINAHQSNTQPKEQKHTRRGNLGKPWQALASLGKPWQALARKCLASLGSLGKPWQASASLTKPNLWGHKFGGRKIFS
jgi:hypothetical protein